MLISGGRVSQEVGMTNEKALIHKCLACLKKIKESSMVCHKVIKRENGRRSKIIGVHSRWGSIVGLMVAPKNTCPHPNPWIL